MAQRGAAYPSMSLSAAVDKAGTILEKLGRGQIKRSLVRETIGYSSESGPAKRAMASLAYYGIIERVGDDYKLSALAKRVLIPITEEDSESAKRELALKPDLYRKLYTEFSGQVLPASLANILVHQYNINGSDAAVKNFKESLRYAGLLNDSDEVVAAEVEVSHHDAAVAQFVEALQPPEPARSSSAANAGNLRTLPSGITITFPDVFDYAVLTGEFGAEVKALEMKAQNILNHNKSGKGSGDESEAQ